MSIEDIGGVVLVGLFVLAFIGKIFPARKPKQTYFKCTRCGVNSPHTDRTIEAWRNNKVKFFCRACHQQWIQSRPPQAREHVSSSTRPGAGCLGAVVLITFMPIGGYWLMQAYA